MTEQVPPTGPGDGEPEEQEPAADDRQLTGVPAVDAALAEVDRLSDLPLEERLAAFERVHESLRTALDAPSVDHPDDLA
ncbi:MAG TPA: hypothetical protein VGK78_00015 [Nocardioides sp.]|uniref:hypothetical protein n=1 Tax=Nocardioides sp. TaxID=35761 RepID=UPI002F3F3F8C